jgi:O-antigen ligase
MQHLFTKGKMNTWWLLSIAALFFFVTGIITETYFLVTIPFVFLSVFFFTYDLRFLYFILLFAIPLSTEFSVTSTLSTDMPDEPLMLLLSGSLIAVLLLRPSFFPSQILKSSLALLLILQFGWMLITVIYSTELLLSIKYVLAKSWFFIAFVLGGLMFLKTKEDYKLASKAFIFAMLIPVIGSLIRHAIKGFSFNSINETLSPFFRNHVNYSALLVCLFPILFMWHHFSGGRTRKWTIALIVLFFIALFFAFSRGAWLCLLTGALTWYAIKKKFLLSFIIIAGMMMAIALYWLIQNDNYLKFAPDFNKTRQHTNITEHIEATYELKDMSTMERFYRWIAGIRMVNREKLKGYGPNSFSLHYKEYTVNAFKTWVSSNEEKSSVHNYFLLLAVEQGIPGMILFIILLLTMFSIAVKAYHTLDDAFDRALAMLCGVILSMIVTLNMLSDLIETDKIGSLFFIITGIFIQLQVKLLKRKEMKMLN